MTDTIAGLAAALRAGTTTPSALAAAAYDAAAAAGPTNAFISLVEREELLGRAAAMEARGPDGLALYGIPFAAKDNIDAAGVATTAACPGFAYVPDADATAVARLQAAGALLVGKTNMDQFATGLAGTRSPYGACSSLFDPRHVSGGSSSGSAVAVAAGIVPFALGSDTAGSGRVPAAFNGLVGLKPTRGLVSTAGVVPACPSLDCIAVFAHDADGARRVLTVVAGEDPGDPFSRAAPAPGHGRVAGRPLRLGVPADAQLDLDDAAWPAWQASVEAAHAVADTVVEVEIAPLLEAATLLYGGPWLAERHAAFGAALELHGAGVDPVVRSIVLGAEQPSAEDVFAGQRRLAELAHAAAPLWAAVDALVLPTTPGMPRLTDVAADPVGTVARLGTYTNFVNLLDLCGVAVPSGRRPDGLPFGVTLLAPAFGDAALLDLAARWPAAGGRLAETDSMALA